MDLRSLLRKALPEVDGVHVAVSSDAHSASFSEQWDRWATTQVDSCGYHCGYLGWEDSADIFARKTALEGDDLEGRVVLDAGCGTGRFSEVAAQLGAEVVAVDLSHAVFHAAKLGKDWPSRLFIQANLEDLPLEDGSVDVAFSIGVLHHTPDPVKALQEIRRVLKPGGIFAGWVYQKQPTYTRPERGTWRAFSTDPQNRVKILELALRAPEFRDLFGTEQATWAINRMVALVPMLGELAETLAPWQFRQIVGISGSRNDDECRLDSFDWMTPKYQWQYTWEEWWAVLEKIGFADPKRLEVPVSWRTIK